MNQPALTLYFDGNCPFCAAEMARLRSWDNKKCLGFVNIAEPEFNPAELGVDMAALDLELHSKRENGEILVGIDSMLAAYTLVGKGWLVFPLRFTALRPVLSDLYRKFARNRYKLSRWMGYKAIPQCDQGVCRRVNPFFDK